MAITAEDFAAYRKEIEREKRQPLDRYGMVLIARIVADGHDAALRAADDRVPAVRARLLHIALDGLMPYAWLAAFFSTKITWRRHRARLGRDMEMIQIAA